MAIQGDGDRAGRREPREQHRRPPPLTEQSRVRLAAVEELREQYQLIVEHSRRRLEASRRLLERRTPPEQV